MTNDQWATPTPLRPDGTNLLPFPVNALPPIIGDMADAIATTTSTDVAMTGTAMLSAVGYCFTCLYRLAGKADHTEPSVLYSIIIAQPSERKSPVMHFIKAPFDNFERKYTSIIIKKQGIALFCYSLMIMALLFNIELWFIVIG